jgi:hypothetical protein
MSHRSRKPDPIEDGPASADDKTCASCGRRIGWLRKWATNWDEVRYCSDACRRRGVTAADAQQEAAIRESLVSTRSVLVDDTEDARRAARRLVAKGAVELVQSGRVVDPSTAKGPFQIRRI